MQSNKEITVKRASLYEEVWTDPVIIVAKRYGLSDNGLRKIFKNLVCRCRLSVIGRGCEQGRK